MKRLRVLFTFVGGMGHFVPLEPFAGEARAAGHEVLFACGPDMGDTVRAAGFKCSAVGRSRARSPERTPLLPPDVAREERDLCDRFVRRAARERVPLLLGLCRDWRPDLVVCDETDFGSMLAAELGDLPWASVQVTAAGSFVRPDVVGEALTELRAEHGLAADPSLEMLARYLVLSPFPPSFREPSCSPAATVHALRGALDCAEYDASSPPLALARPDAPVVYLTLGTVFNLESGDLFERLLAGASELPVNLFATVGPGIDPAELGPQPAWVRVERYRVQHEVLPHCSLVVSHAGSGSLMGALAYGLPSVLLPLGADQLANAARAEALGFARVLDPVAVSPGALADCVREALEDVSLRVSAECLRDEIRSLPGAAHGVALLERLAETRAPVRADGREKK